MQQSAQRHPNDPAKIIEASILLVKSIVCLLVQEREKQRAFADETIQPFWLKSSEIIFVFDEIHMFAGSISSFSSQPEVFTCPKYFPVHQIIPCRNCWIGQTSSLQSIQHTLEHHNFQWEKLTLNSHFPQLSGWWFDPP